MSAGARITLATATILSAIGFLVIGIYLGPGLPAGSWPFYALASFCTLIAIACLVRTSRPVTLRIIGAVILLGYVAYGWDSIGDANFFRAITGLLVWGLPAGYLAIWGTYPEWGRGSAAFDNDEPQSQSE